MRISSNAQIFGDHDRKSFELKQDSLMKSSIEMGKGSVEQHQKSSTKKNEQESLMENSYFLKEFLAE